MIEVVRQVTIDEADHPAPATTDSGDHRLGLASIGRMTDELDAGMGMSDQDRLDDLCSVVARGVVDQNHVTIGMSFSVLQNACQHLLSQS